MIVSPQIPLHRLVLSLAEGMDRVHPSVADHQLRVAYIATNVARHLGFRGQALLDVFQAGAFHDIGLIRLEDRLLLRQGSFEGVRWHPQAGAELLADQDLFGRAADIVRFHHTAWRRGEGAERAGREVPFASHILVLADAVERAIQADLPVLEQSEFITKQILAQSDAIFHPDCVEAFADVAAAEAFWLDCTSERIYSILLEQMDWPILTVDGPAVSRIAGMFARVVDAMSPWTATHSIGVASTAVALGRRMGLSVRELTMLRSAGLLHDIGKLAVPSRILDKPGDLTPTEHAIIRAHTYHTFRILRTIGGMPQICEWASFHHERLDGSGYPFRHRGDDLTLPSRILAVADMFTAMCEDRPYRPATSLSDALAALTESAEAGRQDAAVVATLREDASGVHEAMQAGRAEHADKQRRLTRFLKPEVRGGAPVL